MRTTVALIVVALCALMVACAGAWGDARQPYRFANSSNTDNNPPIVRITGTLHVSAEQCGVNCISLSGEASDDGDVASVRWDTDQAKGGECQGKSSWKAAEIPLSPGRNLVTVTATDAAGNVGCESVEVTGTAEAALSPDGLRLLTVPGQMIKVAVGYLNDSDRDLENAVVRVVIPAGMERADDAGFVFWRPDKHLAEWLVERIPARASGVREIAVRME